MRIEELSAVSCREWDEYVCQHPASTVYHDRAWQLVAQRAYRLPTQFLLARSESSGSVCGALPLFRIDGVVRPHLSNGLFGAYAPVLGEDEVIRLALLEHAKKLVKTKGLPQLILKTIEGPEPEHYAGFTRVEEFVIASLKLEKDPDLMWSKLRDKIRNCVRKGVKSGLEDRAGMGQIEHFYDVLAENMHSKGSPIYGRQFMRELASAFGDRAEVITLWHGDDVVSGAILFFHNGTTYVPFASSRPSSLQMSPNNLLYWEIIRRSILRGMKVLDFGRSRKDSGPLAFKTGWGAQVQPQPLHVHSPNGTELSVDSKHKGANFFVNQWKRLPRGLADSLGPYVCRQVAGII